MNSPGADRSSTNRKPAGQFSLGTGSHRTRLLVNDMDKTNAILDPKRLNQWIDGVPGDSENLSHTELVENFKQLFIKFHNILTNLVFPLGFDAS